MWIIRIGGFMSLFLPWVASDYTLMNTRNLRLQNIFTIFALLKHLNVVKFITCYSHLSLLCVIWRSFKSNVIRLRKQETNRFGVVALVYLKNAVFVTASCLCITVYSLNFVTLQKVSFVTCQWRPHCSSTTVRNSLLKKREFLSKVEFK